MCGWAKKHYWVQTPCANKKYYAYQKKTDKPFKFLLCIQKKTDKKSKPFKKYLCIQKNYCETQVKKGRLDVKLYGMKKTFEPRTRKKKGRKRTRYVTKKSRKYAKNKL